MEREAFPAPATAPDGQRSRATAACGLLAFGGSAAGVQRRVSGGGDMAIEDTNLTVRQPKVFYAAAGVVHDANVALGAANSAYEL